MHYIHSTTLARIHAGFTYMHYIHIYVHASTHTYVHTSPTPHAYILANVKSCIETPRRYL